MTNIRAVFLISAVLLSGFLTDARSEEWTTAKSTHFIVYYKNAPERFISEISDKAEEYYDKITDELGFTRYNFWLWDNRAKIYIHDTQADYQAATGQPRWSSGCVYIKDKVIHSFPFAKNFYDTVLPHEMGHIIFRELVGFDNPGLPVWLDEGVASYTQESKYFVAPMVKDAMRNGRLISLKDLSMMNPQEMSDTAQVDLFYAEAISVVEFLLKRRGQDTFLSFCQALRDKRNFEQALAYAYSYADIDELDVDWRKNL